MTNIGPHITAIEKLLEDGSLPSLTYAALECRLAIELACYDRFRIAFDYASFSDMKGWSPKPVMDHIVEYANDMAAKGFVLSVSKEPASTVNEVQNIEYHELGQQSAIDFKNLSRLYHSLSSVALHVKLPVSKTDHLSGYGELGTIRKKVVMVLKHLKAISEGSLMTSGIGEEYKFTCDICRAEIKRKVALIKHGMTVSCSSGECEESYILTVDGQEIMYQRRVIELPCEGQDCNVVHLIPKRVIEGLKVFDRKSFTCLECDGESSIYIVPCKKNHE